MNYQHILVAVDGSLISRAAANQAIAIAKVFHAKVTVLSVIALDPFIGVDFFQIEPTITGYFIEAEAEAKRTLAEIQQLCDQEGIISETKIISGQPFIDRGILETAEELKVDLIVMGSHGRKGFKKLMLGSVAQSVLNETHLPVLVVKQ